MLDVDPEHGTFTSWYFPNGNVCARLNWYYGRAATKVRRCPREGVTEPSRLRGCPPEGVVGHVTEGFPPSGISINTRGGKDMWRLERLRL